MPDLPSRFDLYSIGRDYVRSKATKIDPATIDVEGSDVNLVVGSSSVMADHVVKHLGYRFNALLLNGAEKEDLDRYAFDRYQLTRKGASAALTKVSISRSAATFGQGSVPLGTQIVATTGAEYITTSVANFGASDLVSSTNVRASNAGKASQVTAGALRRFKNASALFDPTLRVTNAAASAHGEDVESDVDFRARIRLFWKTARRGILPAIEFGALTVPGIATAQAIEVLTTGALPARLVELYVADSSGIASDVITGQVSEALLDYRAGGIAVIISTSIPFIASISLRLRFRANVNTVFLAEQVRAAVVAFINSIPVNGPLFIADLYSVLRRFSADGLIVDAQTIVSPVGDLVPTVGQTIRTTLGNVLLATAA